MTAAAQADGDPIPLIETAAMIDLVGLADEDF